MCRALTSGRIRQSQEEQRMEPRSDQKSGQSRSAAEIAEKAKQTAGELAGAAKDVAVTRAQGFVASNKEAAVSQIGAVANALRSVSTELEGRQEPLASAARRAADTIEGFSRALEQRDLSEALESAQDYARRQPALFFGGAFLLGLAAARFLKASAERQHQRFEGSYDASYPVSTGASAMGSGAAPTL
jgi:hypothetical protein